MKKMGSHDAKSAVALWPNERKPLTNLLIVTYFSVNSGIYLSPSIQDCRVHNGIQVDNLSSPCLNLCFAFGSLTLEIIEEHF